jgi:hypothetical protein
MKTTSKQYKWLNAISITLCLFFFTGTLDLFAATSGSRSSFSSSVSSPSKVSTPSVASKPSTPAPIVTKPTSGGPSSFANAAPTPSKPTVSAPPSKPDTVANVPPKPTTTGPVPSGGQTSFVNAAPTPTPVSNVSRPQVVPVKSVSEVRTVYTTVPANYTPPVVIVTRNPSYTNDYVLLTYQLSVMNAMHNAAERAEMRKVMEGNPAYSSWKSEAKEQAAQNAELRRELDAINNAKTGMSGGSIFLLILTGCCIVGAVVYMMKRR